MSPVLPPENAAASGSQPTPPHRRRDKKQLSCDFCRQRKRQPCGACTVRGLGPACSYPSDSRSPIAPALPRAQPQPNVASLEDRLKRLEDLVLASMKSARVQQDNNAGVPAQPSNPLSTAQSEPSAESGTMHISSQGTTYFASPHWEAIMDEISDLKDDFRRTDEGNTPIEPAGSHSPCRVTSNTPLLLYGAMQPASKEELVSALPGRVAADRLIFRYFNELSILPGRCSENRIWFDLRAHTRAARVVHPPVFLEQYEGFWANPSAVSMPWLGLLYGVLSLSDFFSSEPVYGEFRPQPKYLECLVQCLIAADYVHGGPYILECLIHYFLVEFYFNPVTEVGNWMVAGMMAQLAFRMGYHRDPSHFPRISAFEGEIRRRVWATVHIFDSTMAMLIGAPRVIPDGTWNTRPPRNISDADLHQDCVEEPESRADTEVTEVSFLLARYTMSLAMGRLVDLSLANKLESPEDVKSAETCLKATYESMPERFKFTSLVHCLSDKPVNVAHRVIITCLHNKSRIILYQRQLRKIHNTCSTGRGSREESEDWSSTARCKCIIAALEIIEHLVFLDMETQPGGTMTTLRSKVSPLVVHECLVATAALSTYLYRWPDAPLVGENGEEVSKLEIEAMLRKSYQTWSHWSNWSAEARRAVELLDLLFKKLGHNSPDVGIDETGLSMDEMELSLDWDAEALGIFFPLLNDLPAQS